ncbi:Dynamin, GTPase domain protein [Akanthomyces lecanii RCEF 1005]|uniref:Dynamin, GTPase domain protein n=1 Tax=Akanthomyces lecanii RCEF 1005 TaxID=1081108 RepID=A0A168EYN5_CORDF|nr:Dynamin, GTPase domain protein [Akanthomyces lecanii RCEF 1005]
MSETYDSLKQLALEHSRIFAVMEKLREAGMKKELIPKLVVVGDQKSGKSSTLEAISGIPFPVKEDFCTKFPIQVVQRMAPQESKTVTVIREDGDIFAAAPEDFHRPVPPNDPAALDAAIREATRLILGQDGSGAQIRQFSQHVLKITVCGPERIPFSLTDLPGLWAAGTKAQTEEDKDYVDAMVRRYIREPRNALLLVITAGSHGGMHRAIAEIQQPNVDPRGYRTLGIMTALDRVYSPREVMDRLDRKEKFNPRHGWHCLRNRTEDERVRGVVRDIEEANYFANNWLDIDESNKGVDSLRPKLNRLLDSRIKDCLPELVKEVERELAKVTDELFGMEPAHRTEDEQKQFLRRMADEFQHLCYEAVNGNYGILKPRPVNLFFYNSQDSKRTRQDKKLQAVVRALSRSFNWVMFKRGKLTRMLSQTRQFREPEIDDQSSDSVSDERQSSPERKRVRFAAFHSFIRSGESTVVSSLADSDELQFSISTSERGEDASDQSIHTNEDAGEDPAGTTDADVDSAAGDGGNGAAEEPTITQALQNLLSGGLDFYSIATKAIRLRNNRAMPPATSALLPHSVSALLREDVLRKYNAINKPVKIEREKAIDKAMKLAGKCRGTESLQEVSSAAVSELTCQETSKWRDISMIHFDAVWQAVECFAALALEHCVPASNISHLKLSIINPGLKRLRLGALERVQELLECYADMNPAVHDLVADINDGYQSRHDGEKKPSPSLLMNIFEAEILERTQPSVGIQIMKAACESLWEDGLGFGWSPTTLVAKSIFNKMEEQLQQLEISPGESSDAATIASQRVEREAADRALTSMESYYELSMMSYLSHFNAMIVQNYLLRKLPLLVFSPKMIDALSSDVVARIAGPRQSDEDKRTTLETRARLLEEALSELQAY